jgi:hypothetical protein
MKPPLGDVTTSRARSFGGTVTATQTDSGTLLLLPCFRWATPRRCSVLAGMPDQSANCIVTSAPYWGKRDYGMAGKYDQAVRRGSRSASHDVATENESITAGELWSAVWYTCVHD